CRRRVLTRRLSCSFRCVFFFSSRRRHTRFSRDWSSDVCSSDLVLQPLVENAIKYGQETSGFPLRLRVLVTRQAAALKIVVANTRSEERRVGKECRSRWSGSDLKKKERQSKLQRLCCSRPTGPRH